MRNSITYIFGLIVPALLISPSAAFAQISDGADFSDFGKVDVQASIGLKIPFGASGKKSITEQARFGVGFNFVQTQTNLDTRQQRLNSYPILNLGLYETKQPSLQLNRQELFVPAPDFIYADDTHNDDFSKDTKSKVSTDAALIVAGGLIIAGGLVYLGSRELEDGFEDAFD